MTDPERNRSEPENTFWRSVIDPDAAATRPKGLLFGALATLLLFSLYGLAAGFFQGDHQLLVSALKIPLILVTSLLLCLPSLFVLASLAGAQLTVTSFFATVLGFAGRLALFAFALVPIVWLFSVSSRYLILAIGMHVGIWGLALLLSLNALSWPGRPARGVSLLWLALLFVVALQVATVFRPVLLREEGAPLFESEKRFFLEHFGDVAEKKSSSSGAR